MTPRSMLRAQVGVIVLDPLSPEGKKNAERKQDHEKEDIERPELPLQRVRIRAIGLNQVGILDGLVERGLRRAAGGVIEPPLAAADGTAVALQNGGGHAIPLRRGFRRRRDELVGITIAGKVRHFHADAAELAHILDAIDKRNPGRTLAGIATRPLVGRQHPGFQLPQRALRAFLGPVADRKAERRDDNQPERKPYPRLRDRVIALAFNVPVHVNEDAGRRVEGDQRDRSEQRKENEQVAVVREKREPQLAIEHHRLGVVREFAKQGDGRCPERDPENSKNKEYKSLRTAMHRCNTPTSSYAGGRPPSAIPHNTLCLIARAHHRENGPSRNGAQPPPGLDAFMMTTINQDGAINGELAERLAECRETAHLG